MRSARRIEVIGLAALVGMAGIEHGVGEAIQGNVAPPGVVFQSWAGVPWFGVLGGEPAMSLVPNLLLSGVLTMIVSVSFMVVAAVLAGEPGAGRVLVGLSALLLLVGGGFGPPLLGLLVAAAAALAARPVGHPRNRLAAAWPWLFGLTAVAWLILFPGLPALAAVVELDEVPVVLGTTLVAFLLVPAGLVAAGAFDARAGHRAAPKGVRP